MKEYKLISSGTVMNLGFSQIMFGVEGPASRMIICKVAFKVWTGSPRL